MNGASDSMKAKYQTYVCELPSVSKAGGSYSEELELRFDIPLGTRVYYTLDGSTPDSTSQEYEDAILLDEEGTYKLKYFACNEKGIPSEIGEEAYQLTFQAPRSLRLHRPQTNMNMQRKLL